MSKFWEEQMAHESTRRYYYALKGILSHIELELKEPIEKEILEIGLDLGISARCFLEFKQFKLTSVDGGDVERGIKNIEDMDTGRWTFHHQWSDDYFAECKREFNIIYIDGDHSYEQVKKDINNAWKFLKEGGILIGHDILHKGNFIGNRNYGVNRAFAEFICEQKIEASIYPPHPGLIVVRK